MHSRAMQSERTATGAGVCSPLYLRDSENGACAASTGGGGLRVRRGQLTSVDSIRTFKCACVRAHRQCARVEDMARGGRHETHLVLRGADLLELLAHFVQLLDEARDVGHLYTHTRRPTYAEYCTLLPVTSTHSYCLCILPRATTPTRDNNPLLLSLMLFTPLLFV